MKHRQHRHADVLIAESQQLPVGGAVHVQLMMRQLCALGFAGCARRVNDHRGVIGVGRLNVASVVGAVELVERLRVYRSLLIAG